MSDAAWMFMSECQVVVAYDFSVSGHAALDRALALAKREPWHVLHIVCVIDPRMAFPALPSERVDIEYANRVVAAISALVRGELGDSPFYVHAPLGKKASRAILAVAERVGADLIVIGCKGLTGLERAIVGSTAEQVVREAGCTVEVAKSKRYERVLAFDRGETANHI
jgi:nucleotide-binding universal stress UspA family protein